ncbi:Autophagy-related protein 13 [Hypsizygus marmoreus]|uniref:Autophagy-related protein 13 n=1 Tax=Hypsizygus marmoreus TaxID=39966 RepID=A0A369JAD4_HYPMA|nr:Autophagy-related protein 13 [Hypsizygus marmoreus]
MSLSPGSSGTMSSSDSQKADQIAFHFYTKLFYVVNHARTTNPQPAKLDKWFNLETPDSELFTKDAREPYKSISLAPPPPPLEIQVLLAIPELTNNQVLVHVSPDSSRVRIHPTPRYVLLESFVLDFIPGHTPADVPLPTIYKHGIPLFRSLFTLLRILPAWKLHKRLRRRVGGGPSLGITLRVRDGDDPDVLSLMNMSSQSQTHVFPSVPHPMGSLALSATYLTSPTFQLDELESLLSSRFLSLDQRPFTPTLAKNHLRDSSLSSSPPRISSSQSSSGIPLPLPDRTGGAGSLTRQSLGSRPPPRPSLGSIPRQSALAFTPSRPSTSSGSAAAPSGLTSTRTQLLRNEHEQQLSTSASSLSPTNSFFVTSNADTTTTTTTTPATTATATPPPRRPQLQYPFPFKSNTIASSSSSSPGGLPSSIGGGIPSSLSERIGLDRERVASLPPPLHASRDAGDAGLSHSRGSSLSRGASLSRNTSLRDRAQPRDRSRSRPPDAAPLPVSVPAPVEPGTSPSVPPRKRYSSSFGHRYTGVPGSVGSVGGAGSVGSIASVSGGALVTSGEDSRRIGVVAPHSPLSPSPRHSPSPSSSSNLRPQKRTDDDDISVFVQEIDMRKPLVGRARSGTGTGGEQVEAGSAGRPAHISTSTSPSSPLSSQQPHSSSPLGGQGSQPSHGHGRPHSLSQPYPFHRALTSPPASGQGPLTTITTMTTTTTTTTTTTRAAPIQASSPPGGLMLTSEAEVDERLRRMNEAFLKSLEGLGGSGRPSSSSSASSSSPSNVLRPGLGRAFSERGSGGAGGNEGNSGRGIGLGLDLGVYGARGAGQGSEEVIGRMEFDGEGEGEGEGGGEDGSGNGGGRLPLGMTLGNGRGKGASGSGGRFHF